MRAPWLPCGEPSGVSLQVARIPGLTQSHTAPPIVRGWARITSQYSSRPPRLLPVAAAYSSMKDGRGSTDSGTRAIRVSSSKGIG